ncbi:MAG: carbon monoxide dehydrogenase [Acidiphilium sp. 37-64-53]|uniref:xanthine dehydrogenase family protein molybdopterin-binding subunit n=1 Tax=Acidiphilium TaxID=522 RepID=UPI000BD1BC65|nr:MULTISPECIES: xanthine dehydrogenase family protein molybdopterin-binding subunit [Acidiphilium]OYW01346.1 MAG: carbon monoxide dehydrogenase [Acidiphilium sp. 37-64-53]OZB24459.1 MAG: carbon monoxide dehydrogenase [Acidiphilium sp. 34-64-41]HQT85957.1 xanthine dehydrogenase family protein molybdopterin-binding subunit [Acidiphilium rubrum]
MNSFSPLSQPAANGASGRFAIGQPVSRTEDPVLLRGEGHYADDLHLQGHLHGVMVRSRVAHGIIRSLATDAAAAMPGVRAIITAADLEAAGIGPMPAAGGHNHDGSATPQPSQPPLATDRVRYVGDPIAFVVAETAQAAKDAAEAIFADIEHLPAVTEPRDAAEPGAPLVHDDVPGNLVQTFHHGDAEAVAAAFARAAHVTRLPLRNTRIVVSALEPRAATAEFDGETARYTLHLGCQGVFGMRRLLAAVLDVPVERVRVLTGNVGGSFGMKASCYPEYVCLLHAARTLGLPVKWADERSESFLSDSHGRDHDMLAELALDAEGNFLATRLSGVGNLGAYLSNVVLLPATVNAAKNFVGVYRTPLMEVSTRLVFTHTTPVGAYRGAGRPEGNYYMERLVDAAARETGHDPLDLRRRNLIAPAAIPHRAPSGLVYDSGDFPAILDEALAAADWSGFPARKAASAARGRIRGRGIGHYLEVTADASAEMGGIGFDADGGVTITTGTLDYGQGHAAAFAQVVSAQLGIPFDRIRLRQGDSDALIAGGGTGGSRSIMQSGNALLEAGALVIEKGIRAAAHSLEASPDDLEFRAGRFTVAGTDLGIDLMDLAARLRADADLPDDIPASLDVAHVASGVPSAFPNGCHIAEVELDPETGVIALVAYHTVNDFGVLVNPKLVEGQVHGGIVQGIGQALHERVVFDAAGQLVTGSFMDYALPRADSVPAFSFASHPVPARTNRLGVKGCGEAGCAGSLPAVMNAVIDALAAFGIIHLDMPATPERVWAAIRSRQSRGMSGIEPAA